MQKLNVNPIAPVIGGALQHPAERFALFSGNVFFKDYPYFLPCFVSASFSAVTWIIAYFFLEEVSAPGCYRLNFPLTRTTTPDRRC